MDDDNESQTNNCLKQSISIPSTVEVPRKNKSVKCNPHSSSATGFDQMKAERSYGMGKFECMKQESLDELDSLYGKNELQFHPPIKITRHNIEDEHI